MLWLIVALWCLVTNLTCFLLWKCNRAMTTCFSDCCICLHNLCIQTMGCHCLPCTYTLLCTFKTHVVEVQVLMGLVVACGSFQSQECEKNCCVLVEWTDKNISKFCGNKVWQWTHGKKICFEILVATTVFFVAKFCSGVKRNPVPQSSHEKGFWERKTPKLQVHSQGIIAWNCIIYTEFCQVQNS